MNDPHELIGRPDWSLMNSQLELIEVQICYLELECVDFGAGHRSHGQDDDGAGDATALRGWRCNATTLELWSDAGTTTETNRRRWNQ